VAWRHLGEARGGEKRRVEERMACDERGGEKKWREGSVAVERRACRHFIARANQRPNFGAPDSAGAKKIARTV
jgi:hypothetical protein